MRRTRLRLFIIFILLIIILGIFFIHNAFNDFVTQSNKTPLSQLNKDMVNGIVISDGNQTVNLVKKNGQWLQVDVSTSYPADTDRINGLIDGFITLKEGDIVSSNRQNQKNFGIDKRQVTLKTAQKNVTVSIGDSSGMEQNYIRIGDSNIIFVANGLDTIFMPFDYRDLSLHLVNNENNVNSIEIDTSQNKTILQKKNKGWEIDGKPAIRERVDFFINDLKTLKAQNIATSSTQLTISPDLVLTVEENSKKQSISFYANDNNSYDAQVTGRSEIFKIATADVTPFQKTDKDFTE